MVATAPAASLTSATLAESGHSESQPAPVHMRMCAEGIAAILSGLELEPVLAQAGSLTATSRAAGMSVRRSDCRNFLRLRVCHSKPAAAATARAYAGIFG
jgi:hypothetical protein